MERVLLMPQTRLWTRTKMTVYNTCRNILGRIQLELSTMQNLIEVLENPKSTAQQKTEAKAKIKESALKIIKFENTLANKAGYTLTLESTKYTDVELGYMNCM